MTNFCEARGYHINFVRTEKGIRCDLYFQKELYRKGLKYFSSQIDAQKKSYSVLYRKLK